MKRWTDNIGRVLFSAPFIVFGIFHFMNIDGLSARVPEFLSWGSQFFVILTAVVMILAGLSFLINKYIRYSAIVLGVVLLVFALTVHLNGVLSGDQDSMPHLLKDLALAGGAFILAATDL